MDRANPLATITSYTVQKFFWQNIICSFGVPREIVVDNGRHFDNKAFKSFCLNMGTKVKFVSVYHPPSNGAVDRANGMIFSSIRKNLFEEKRNGKWVDELPKLIWSHNTSESIAMGFTPFRLLYSSEAMTQRKFKMKA